ncbi:MAG: efflux RND transporter periplasmic adaptor subunit [Gemmatirosa sp.]|nr:efflux RND transporter periplasmic adaptor subunit [Gemmatirosa sp.]
MSKLPVVLSIAVLGACAPSAPPPPPPPQVTVAPALERAVDEFSEFTGRLEAVDAVEVRPRVSGYVQRIAFAQGGEVRRGDVLFEIDPRPYQATLDRATAELQRAKSRADLARTEVDRARALVDKQAISREEFESRVNAQREAAAAIQGAEAAVESARLDLDWTRVRAPIDGRIGRAEITVGNLVQGGAPGATRLTTIVSVDPIYLAFDSDEQTYLKYGMVRGAARAGSHTVHMALGADTAFAREGRLEFVDNQLDAATGTVRARAVFDNHDRSLAPGLFARVRLGGGRAPAVLVRDAAVGTDQDRKFVLTLKADSTLEYRQVTLGPLVDGLRVVAAGVSAGDRVVVNGLQRVRPGARVSASEQTMGGASTLASTTR